MAVVASPFNLPERMRPHRGERDHDAVDMAAQEIDHLLVAALVVHYGRSIPASQLEKLDEHVGG